MSESFSSPTGVFHLSGRLFLPLVGLYWENHFSVKRVRIPLWVVPKCVFVNAEQGDNSSLVVSQE